MPAQLSGSGADAGKRAALGEVVLLRDPLVGGAWVGAWGLGSPGLASLRVTLLPTRRCQVGRQPFARR